MYKTLYLKKGKEESLKRFHPWIFSGAVAQIEDGVEEGEIVRVFTSQGDFIAVGMYQIGSIAVRVLSFRDVEIDGEFWFSRWSTKKPVFCPFSQSMWKFKPFSIATSLPIEP